MTDREEFKPFWDWVKKEPFYDDLSGAEKSIAKRAWQARGELDAKKIADLKNVIVNQGEMITALEAKNKELVMHLSNMMECTAGFAPSTRFIVNAREALAKEGLNK